MTIEKVLFDVFLIEIQMRDQLKLFLFVIGSHVFLDLFSCASRSSINNDNL